jgi:hypothetical protein
MAMTQNEKLGTLLARMAGVAFALESILDLMRMFEMLLQYHIPISSLTIGSCVWPLAGIAVGVLMFLLAKPIGCFLAKGLE